MAFQSISHIEILIFPVIWSWAAQILCKEEKQGVKGKNEVVCEVLWKSQCEDKGDPGANPLKGIKIPNTKGSHRNLAVGGLERGALCIRTQGKKNKNTYIYMCVCIYIYMFWFLNGKRLPADLCCFIWISVICKRDWRTGWQIFSGIKLLRTAEIKTDCKELFRDWVMRQ